MRLNSDDLFENSKLAGQAGLKIDDVIVNYCNGEMCWRSPAVSAMLKGLGYKNVNWLRSGLSGWIKKGYETAEGKQGAETTGLLLVSVFAALGISLFADRPTPCTLENFLRGGSHP